MALSTRRAGGFAAALAVVASLAMAGSAFGADHRVVKIQDDCDQASFDAVVGDGTCVGDGRTLFADFLAEFQAQGSVDRWAFSRPEFNIDAGGTIEAVNEGGERHTFTKVEEFGNGCIPLLNADDSPPVVDCNALGDSEVLPGASRTFPVPATAGTVLYQCAIHPWMRSVVDVRAEGNRGGRG